MAELSSPSPSPTSTNEGTTQSGIIESGPSPTSTDGPTQGGGVTQAANADGFTDDAVSKDLGKFGEPEYLGPPKEVEKEFTYATHVDPARRLGGGPYLDDVMRQQAEITRAKIEGREPDLKNPPAMQSTPLVPINVARGYVPGDQAHHVEADVTLPVVVGYNPNDLDSNAEAKRQHENESKDDGE